MKVEDKRSAFDSVTGAMRPKPLIRIELRRVPQLSFAQIRQMLTSLADIVHVRMGIGDQFSNSYFVVVNQRVNQERLDEMVADICRLASVII